MAYFEKSLREILRTMLVLKIFLKNCCIKI